MKLIYILHVKINIITKNSQSLIKIKNKKFNQYVN